MSYQSLSYVLSSRTPLYGDSGAVVITRTRSMARGDSSNNSELSFPAHAGTHIDAPFHFDVNGRTLDSYPPDFWICARPHLIERGVEPSEVIGLEGWREELESVPVDTDLLLLKTGFEAWRETSEYATHGPGFAADVGLWLRRNRRLKMIGFDFVSLSSFQNRALGREAHRAFLGADTRLGAQPGDPVLIIEDMKLSGLQRAPSEVLVAPLVFENADGAPVCVIARV